MNTPLGRPEVKCIGCGTWSPSQISFGNKESFESSKLSRNRQNCSGCGALTPCNKENMRWAQTDGKGGFVGNDTMG